MRYALSYAAQQVSGLWSWVRDAEHVEKAFDFSGMGARNGVTAAIMAQMGFTGVWDVFDGEHNALAALSTAPKPEEMVAGLGSRYFVTETAIKPFSVGYPIQAPLDAFLTLHREHGLTVSNVERIVVRLPEDGARIVNDRAMPDVNCQHIIAVALVDGTVSFEDSHSYERMKDPKVRAAKERVQLIADPKLMDPAAPRSGLVEVTLRGWPYRHPLYTARPGHEGKSDGYGERKRKGAAPDGAGAGRRADRGTHPAGERRGRAGRCARATAIPGTRGALAENLDGTLGNKSLRLIKADLQTTIYPYLSRHGVDTIIRFTEAEGLPVQ